MILSHFTLPVGDLDVAQRFYVDQLGFHLERRIDATNFRGHRPERESELEAANSPFHLAVRVGGEASLDLFLQRGLARAALRPHPHFAFAVSSAGLREKKRELEEAGVRVDGPRRLGPPGQASLYFSDPWGNLLELVCMGWTDDVALGPPDLSKL